ncbi:MAG: glycosyltransferase [Bacteroidales bacterium]
MKTKIFEMEKEKLKALFLARWYPHKNDPMFGLFVERHAESISSLYDLSVISIVPVNKQKKRFVLNNFTKNGINNILVYYKTTNTSISIFRGLLRMSFFLISFLKAWFFLIRTNGKPDFIHVHVLSRFGVIASILKLVYNIPYYITEHWSRYLPVNSGFNGFLRRKLTRIAVKHSSGITAVTKDLRKAIQSYGINHEKFVILPNVVDSKLFYYQQKESSKIKNIVHISCFEDRSKNIKGIVRVIGRLSQIRDDFKLILIGDGEDMGEIRLLSDELNLTGRFIHFMGIMEGIVLAKELQKADFTLQFSNYENFPVVISESLCCGVPVLSSRVGGIPEYITEDNGVLCDPKDEDQLLEKINLFLDKCDKYDRLSISKDAQSIFAKNEVANFLEMFYDLGKK